VLGREPKAYAEWIRKDTSWGGAIELAIFSDIYQTEIASFDVKTGRMDLFGEDQHYSTRVYLQYTGIHSEAFALALGADADADAASEPFDVTIFSPQDRSALDQVRELVQAARLSHRFTDTTAFTLRCEQCRAGLRGETEAQKHAKATGHASFVEYLGQ
jgi:ubiquitin thioesterase OTU1